MQAVNGEMANSFESLKACAEVVQRYPGIVRFRCAVCFLGYLLIFGVMWSTGTWSSYDSLPVLLSLVFGLFGDGRGGGADSGVFASDRQNHRCLFFSCFLFVSFGERLERRAIALRPYMYACGTKHYC